MKKLYSFFYLKKKVQIKHTQNLSLIVFRRKKLKKKKNAFFLIFLKNLKKKITQNTKLNIQETKNTTILKKSFPNQWKSIILTYYLQKIVSAQKICRPNSALTITKFFYLNWLKSNIFLKIILLKREKIIKNFSKFLFSIFNLSQSILVSFFSWCLKLFNCKQNIKNYLYTLQKKFLNKKLKFAILLFQFFLKTIKKYIKKTLFFFNVNVLKKKESFLFIQFLLEFQFSFFYIYKKFQSFLVKKNVLQICLQNSYLKSKKRKKIFFINQQKLLSDVFPFSISTSARLNDRQSRENRDCYEAQRVQVKGKMHMLKLHNLMRCLLCFAHQKLFDTKMVLFQIWSFIWKNFYTLIDKKNVKFLYKLNIQKKQKTKFCFLLFHNIIKVGKIFSLFFDFTKKNFCKASKNENNNLSQKIQEKNYVSKFKNSSLAALSQKPKNIYNTKVNLGSFPFSFNQVYSFNKNDILSQKHKKIFCVFLKYIKKSTLLFFENFCLFNCLKTQRYFFHNSNDFQILFHQQLKFSFLSSQKKNKHKKKFYMQSLMYCDYFTFFSFLEVFLIIKSQKSKNDSFLNFFHQYFNLYLIKNIENMCKIDQIHLLKNFKKSFCKTNSQKFLKFFQKKVDCLNQKTLNSQIKQTNKLLINQIRIFNRLILFKLFYSYFEKILFHIYKTFQLQQLQKYFYTKYNNITLFDFLNFNFCIKNKCFKNSILKPIYFIYKYYYENFVVFQSIICSFFNSQKPIKLMKRNFSKCEIFNKWWFHFFEKTQIHRKNFVFRNLPLIHLFKFFFINISKKQKSTVQLFHFHNMFWLLSNKINTKSTKLNKKYFFSFSAFFSSFLSQKSQNTILYRQMNFRKNTFLRKNIFHLNFEGYAVYLNFILKKKSKVFFVFQKMKTLQNIQIYLKQCQQILKISIGKKQLFFMKKIQKKMKVWCQEYKKNVSNCLFDSALIKLTTKKIFHYCDSILLKYLWSWAQKTHPNKNKGWIQKKYFHFLHSKKWFFGKKVGKILICLPLHSQTKI